MTGQLLDRARIEQVLEAITEREGEWLLVGGAFVALWLEPRRTTEDIDIVGLRGTPEERYALMDVAEQLGLPVEAVNSAADFFVHRIDGWREQITILRKGARGTIYRPTVTLFVLLKMRRLSERDLDDCEAALLHARGEGETVDVARLLAALAALPPTSDADLERRRGVLRAALGRVS